MLNVVRLQCEFTYPRTLIPSPYSRLREKGVPAQPRNTVSSSPDKAPVLPEAIYFLPRAHLTMPPASIAPACRAISRPFLNSARVGMLRML